MTEKQAIGSGSPYSSEAPRPAGGLRPTAHLPGASGLATPGPAPQRPEPPRYAPHVGLQQSPEEAGRMAASLGPLLQPATQALGLGGLAFAGDALTGSNNIGRVFAPDSYYADTSAARPQATAPASAPAAPPTNWSRALPWRWGEGGQQAPSASSPPTDWSRALPWQWGEGNQQATSASSPPAAAVPLWGPPRELAGSFRGPPRELAGPGQVPPAQPQPFSYGQQAGAAAVLAAPRAGSSRGFFGRFLRRMPFVGFAAEEIGTARNMAQGSGQEAARNYMADNNAMVERAFSNPFTGPVSSQWLNNALGGREQLGPVGSAIGHVLGHVTAPVANLGDYGLNVASLGSRVFNPVSNVNAIAQGAPAVLQGVGDVGSVLMQNARADELRNRLHQANPNLQNSLQQAQAQSRAAQLRLLQPVHQRWEAAVRAGQDPNARWVDPVTRREYSRQLYDDYQRLRQQQL